MGSHAPEVAVLWALVTASAAHADDAHVVACRPTVTCTADLAPPGTLELELLAVDGPQADQPWAALAAKLGCALEPRYFADAAPLAPRDAGAIAAIEYARAWLVVDGAVDLVAWAPRSVTATDGGSLAPVRIWGR